MLLQFVVLLVSVFDVLKFRYQKCIFFLLYIGIFHLLETLLKAVYVFFVLVVTSYSVSSPSLVMKLTVHVCGDLHIHIYVHLHGMVPSWEHWHLYHQSCNTNCSLVVTFLNVYWFSEKSDHFCLVYLMLTLMTQIVHFIMSVHVAALLHRKPASAGTFQGPGALKCACMWGCYWKVSQLLTVLLNKP